MGEWGAQSLRIPRLDWARVVVGEKTEIRHAGRGATLAATLKERVPLPIIGWSVAKFGGNAQHELLVAEAAWVEPLGAITAESIANEGFASFQEFQAYWKERHISVGFRPLHKVQVVKVRPWRDGDRDFFAAKIIEHIYGQWLPQS